MYCECGFMIEVSVYNSRVIYCPMCDRKYIKCYDCDTYCEESELIDDICPACWNDIISE